MRKINTIYLFVFIFIKSQTNKIITENIIYLNSSQKNRIACNTTIIHLLEKSEIVKIQKIIKTQNMKNLVNKSMNKPNVQFNN